MLKVAVKEATVVSEGAVTVDVKDLQAIVDATDETPQVRARMTRTAFSSRGWPSEEHPGTVRDFLEANDIPCL